MYILNRILRITFHVRFSSGMLDIKELTACVRFMKIIYGWTGTCTRVTLVGSALRDVRYCLDFATTNLS